MINMAVGSATMNVILKLQKANHEAFVVGGCCRDMLLGRFPHDFDVVTSATPDEIKACFTDMKLMDVGEAFGIVILYDPYYKTTHEIATMRTESDYSDGRHPEKINFTLNIAEDLKRRDFRCNSIAYDPIKGTLIDPCCGGLDVADKIVSCNGSAILRFNEDRLRILRAFRFAAQLNFTFDEDIVDAIKVLLKQGDIFKGVSQERITAEFSKILVAENGVHIIAKMAEMGVLQVIIPEVQAVIDTEHQNPFHLEIWEPFGNSVFSHILHVMKSARENPEFESFDNEKQLIILLGCFLHDINKPSVKAFKQL